MVMQRIKVLVGILLLLSTTAAWPQIVSPSSNEANCGPKIPAKEVLVLDLEAFADDTERAQAFIQKHVHDLEVRSEVAETIRTRLRSARKNRMSAMKRAQKEAAERGCNVVLVLSAWAGPESAAYAQTLPGGRQSIAVGLHYAYAKVLMASGEH